MKKNKEQIIISTEELFKKILSDEKLYSKTGLNRLDIHELNRRLKSHERTVSLTYMRRIIKLAGYELVMEVWE